MEKNKFTSLEMSKKVLLDISKGIFFRDGLFFYTFTEKSFLI